MVSERRYTEGGAGRCAVPIATGIYYRLDHSLGADPHASVQRDGFRNSTTIGDCSGGRTVVLDHTDPVRNTGAI